MKILSQEETDLIIKLVNMELVVIEKGLQFLNLWEKYFY